MESLYTSLEVGPHADALMWVETFFGTLQIGARPLLNERCGEGTRQTEGQAQKPECIDDEVGRIAVLGGHRWQHGFGLIR